MVKSLRGHYVTFAAAMLVSGASAAANLLLNGDFGTDVSAWTAQPSAAASFNPLDASGAPGSGSMRLTNFTPGAGNGTGVAQCIGPVTAGATYAYSGKIRFPTGQGRTGSAAIGLIWYPGPGCTGNDFGRPRASTSVPNDAFVFVNGGAQIAPAGAASVQFIAYPSKVEAGGELVADFDDLVFDDGLPEPPANYQGLWWKPSESGWGVNFAHQGDVVFATWFTYDLTGKAWWLFSVTVETAVPMVYSGPVKTAAGSPFNADPFDPDAVIRTAVGNATITLTDGNHARFDYTVNGVTQTKNLTRQVFAPPGTVCH